MLTKRVGAVALAGALTLTGVTGCATTTHHHHSGVGGVTKCKTKIKKGLFKKKAKQKCKTAAGSITTPSSGGTVLVAGKNWQ